MKRKKFIGDGIIRSLIITMDTARDWNPNQIHAAFSIPTT
jgi:hypothetical protein